MTAESVVTASVHLDLANLRGDGPQALRSVRHTLDEVLTTVPPGARITLHVGNHRPGTLVELAAQEWAAVAHRYRLHFVGANGRVASEWMAHLSLACRIGSRP